MPSGNHINLDAMTGSQNDKEVTHNENLNEFQGAVFDVRSVSVAGGANVNLADVTTLYSAYLELTGVITANIIVDVNNRRKPMWIKNSTTGAFTLTVRPATGTGFVLPRGLNFGLYMFDGAAGMTIVKHPEFGVLLENVAAQSIPDVTSTLLTWDTENYDDAANPGFHNPSSNPGRITIPSSMGITAVRLKARVTYAVNAVGSREGAMALNGGSFNGRALSRIFAASSGVTAFHLETPRIPVVATDFFELSAFQNSGGALNVNGGDDSWFSLEVVA